MIYEEYDNTLNEAIQTATPEFGSSLKRRFTNVGVSQSMRNSNNDIIPIKLDDVFIRDGQNRIQLKNIEIRDPLVPRMNEIVPNLKERHLRIHTDWYNITLCGTYQMFNTSQIKLLPVVSTGDFIISIEDTVGSGSIGFTTAGEALEANNFDISFDARNVSVQVEYYNNFKKAKESNCIRNEEIGNTIAKHLRTDLFLKLEESLRVNLNQVLMDYNLMEIFGDNTEICDKYRNMVQCSERATDRYVDKVIAEVNLRSRITFNLPSISESGFCAQEGKLSNLQSLQRQGAFTKIINNKNGHVTLFGEIEMEKCLATYGYWNYWILHGFLKVNVQRQRIKLKVTTTSSNFLRASIILKEARLRVITLQKLDIDISGLGIFSWVADQVEAIVKNVYKTDVTRLLSDRLNKNLQQLVEKSPYKRNK